MMIQHYILVASLLIAIVALIIAIKRASAEADLTIVASIFAIIAAVVLLLAIDILALCIAVIVFASLYVIRGICLEIIEHKKEIQRIDNLSDDDIIKKAKQTAFKVIK